MAKDQLLLESVFNHLVLPPKLPKEQDKNSDSIERNILSRISRACYALSACTGEQFQEIWDSLRHSVRICSTLNRGYLEKASMVQAFHDLKPKELIILHVVEQNAALLIHRRTSHETETVIFEVFEASPTAEDVLAAENALQWDFPGRAVEIPLAEFLDDSFRENLAVFLEQASRESLHRFMPHVTKAKVRVGESRDTSDPALIAQMLMPLLEAIGSSINTPKLRKRVRDDVIIHNTTLPWRRLPFWLILRVAIQRQIYLALGDEVGRACYKFLICTVLTELLEDCSDLLSPELTILLKAKLCRRLAKLEIDKSLAKSSSAVYEQLFDSIGLKLKKKIEKAAEKVEKAWEDYKNKIKRPIPMLDSRADQQSLRLSLKNSGKYLDDILALPQEQISNPISLLDATTLHNNAMKQVTKFNNRYFNLAKLESDIQIESTLAPNDAADCQIHAQDLATSIMDLFSAVGDAYKSNPEQMSLFILNLFDLWVQMDKCTIEACPLVAKFAPVFRPELLDTLQLPNLSSMQRLHEIQKHLSARCKSCCTDETILSEPIGDCFAGQYLKQSTHLRCLQRQIEEASEISRLDNQSQWAKDCTEYDRLSQQIPDEICCCIIDPDDGYHYGDCLKCYLERCRKRLKHTVHEDFLPEMNDQKAALVFELQIPPFLADYRNATFEILSNLGHPNKHTGALSELMTLEEYSQLQPFMNPRVNGVTLASEIKSFLRTHFKQIPAKADISEIRVPLGLKFSYYDTKSKRWLKDLNKPLSFQHLCGVHVPRSLRSLAAPSSEHNVLNLNGLSSYKIAASLTKCPSDLSIHEFMAYQRLPYGKHCRWLTMLVELGSTNINFNTEDAMLMFNHLAMQAGPTEKEDDVLRVIHSVFHDQKFCQRLVEQIESRLRSISTSRHEIYCMEVLITLCLRLFHLKTDQNRQSAEKLLEMARNSTLDWISRLRDEVRNTSKVEVVEKATRYGLWAALLCRRTFDIFSASNSKLDAKNLCTFIQATAALRENLVVDPANLPLHTRNMLVRDLKMAYGMQQVVKEAIKSYPESLGIAINHIWSDSSNSARKTHSQWQFFAYPKERWAMSVINTANNDTVSQTLHFNFIEGDLLVDGKPLGRLPPEMRESEDIKELFGDQHLSTFPSSLTGMSHVMATPIWGNEVHFGFRGKNVIVKARRTINNIVNTLEYVPRRIFTHTDGFDLPYGLTENCVHWLNLNTKRLEIRRKPVIWKTRARDWILDVVNRQARRNNVQLVDPYSNLCKRVAGIFRDFEDPRRLTVFQPTAGRLSVEMRHLELSFFVNNKRLLQCRELNAEIDPNQDAGTLYGFQGKIVVRDTANTERRSIITSLGNLTCSRDGIHVAVNASSTCEYARFSIDNVLGRLSCPPEPWLLYLKALFHAYTSFEIPDPLTGRTGAEEALCILKSGYCQPFVQLPDHVIGVLKHIKSLSPSRMYYPRDKRSLQTVIWNDKLTTAIQNDGYEYAVNQIILKSDRLGAFTVFDETLIVPDKKSPSHLRRRGEIRCFLYKRNVSDLYGVGSESDRVYTPRDRYLKLTQARNVYQIARHVRKQPYSIYMSKSLEDILSGRKLIGGFFGHSADTVSGLFDLIEKSIGEQWGSLLSFCRQVTAKDIYKLIFRLGLLSFAIKPDMDFIRSLAAFACLDELKALQAPSGLLFLDFNLDKLSPTQESLLEIIKADYLSLEPESEAEESKEEDKSAQKDYEILCNVEGTRLAQFLLKQWPSSEVSGIGFESDVINVDSAMEKILPEWRRFYQNTGLAEYVSKAQQILHLYEGEDDNSVPRPWSEAPVGFHISNRGPTIPSLSRNLITKRGPVTSSQSPEHQIILSQDQSQRTQLSNEDISTASRLYSTKETIELGRILNSFTTSPDVLRRQYGNDLEKSLLALERVRNNDPILQEPPSVQYISKEIEKAHVALESELKRIRTAFATDDGRFQWLQLGNLWPCTTRTALLEQLRSSSNLEFGQYMKEALTSYGVLFTTLQRLLRIRHAQLKKAPEKVLEEWRNNGHENWCPLEFPDWLLLEIESDLLIRREQIDVARAVISPVSESNSVLQMNMGGGKTSCIVPMAMAVLANKRQLSRLIVPKALLLQTAQLMQAKLGGLIGREIRHIPFFRRTPTTAAMLQMYSEHHFELLGCCGIILTTPEHLLSYKLSGLQQLTNNRLEEAKTMIEFQSWLTDTCRDVLDESDFSLAVKTQLIYPNGLQTSVDSHPHRWQIVQTLLSLVEDHLVDLQRDFPQSIEVIQRSYGFPIVHFLQQDVEEALKQRLINNICDGRIPVFCPMDSSSAVSKQEIKQALSEMKLDYELVKRASIHFEDRFMAMKIIFLLRGLLSNGILLLCLKRRWNVQYGLHPNRHPIAVPFEAKGVPSEQAEFGHPDMSILYTCLAFYYSGLTLPQFRESLRHVLKSDDPAAEYSRWTSGPNTLSKALHHWNIINGDDQQQVEELWGHLRLNRNVLDHYMNNYVFPIYAKQFSVKLQASGWDLPLFSRLGPEKMKSDAITTGFSGTNDNKMMLPLNIKQDDLMSLRQTNAEVLTYILQSRNRNYKLAASDGKRLTEEELLWKLKDDLKVRILIDAGAYILEMDNRTLVKEWLRIDTQAKGAVYFGDDNTAWVHYRGGKKDVPLLITPFAETLDECLVYIDEAHTRGVDLKLPQNARGALTLALGQTKDHTMQAAMRLRQLGTTQSIVFIAPPEVHQSIGDTCKEIWGEAIDHRHIDSSHVVMWLLEQTCRTNEHLQSLYLAQGVDFCRRTDAQWTYQDILTNLVSQEAYVKVIRTPELQNLEELYGVRKDTQSRFFSGVSLPELASFMEGLRNKSEAVSKNGRLIHSSILEEVEQEREVEFQVEQIRQIQKPINYTARIFPGLHADISHFVETGNLTGGDGYKHIFESFSRAPIAKKYNVRRTTSRLFISTEFMYTLEVWETFLNLDFLRPVEWILWNPSNETALIIIPEEAELLIPVLRAASNPKVHLITYAAPVTKDMLHFNELSYYVVPPLPNSYTIPQWFSTEVGIFAGRLYMRFSDCSLLKEYLQLDDKNRSISNESQSSSENTNIFTDQPSHFMLEWLSICRKGQDVTHTPMGFLCQGRPLHEDHYFFAAPADTSELLTPLVVDRASSDVDEVEEWESGSENE